VKSLRNVLRTTAIVGAGIGAGAQVFVQKTLVPARRQWSPSMAAQVHQDAMTHRPESYLKPTAVATSVSAIGLLLVTRDRRARILTGVGLAGAVANGAISAKWEWPINREINTWSTDAVPANYPELRDTWDEKHSWRTVASILALVAFVLSALADG
jgi:hypothetical protein